MGIKNIQFLQGDNDMTENNETVQNPDDGQPVTSAAEAVEQVNAPVQEQAQDAAPVDATPTSDTTVQETTVQESVPQQAESSSDNQ